MSLPRHIIVKLQKTIEKDKSLLKTVKEKRQITFKRAAARLRVDLSVIIPEDILIPSAMW